MPEFVGKQRGHMYEDRSGTLWFSNEALYRLEEVDKKVSLQKVELNLPINRTATLVINDIVEGPDGSLWFITSWGPVRRLPDGRESFYSIESAQNDAPVSALVDHAGRIWLTRSSGIYVINPLPLSELRSSEALTVLKMDAQAQTQTEKETRLPEKAGEIFRYTSVPGFRRQLA